jgi:hypothetical protein
VRAQLSPAMAKPRHRGCRDPRSSTSRYRLHRSTTIGSDAGIRGTDEQRTPVIGRSRHSPLMVGTLASALGRAQQRPGEMPSALPSSLTFRAAR